MTSIWFPPTHADASFIVATLIERAVDRASFTGSLRREITAQCCADSMALRGLVTTGAVDAIVLDLVTARRASVWAAVRAIVDPYPTIPVLLWLSLTGQDMRDFAAVATDAKPDAVIIREIDDASAVIAAAIRAVREGNATQRVMRAMERLAPPSVRAVLVFAAREAERPLTMHRMAASVGVTGRALIARLHEAGLPGARDVIHWLRLMHVAARLDVPRVTVEQVAGVMGFGSSGALRGLLKRMTRLTPEQLRDAGGFRYLVGVVESRFQTGSAVVNHDSPMADLGCLDRRWQCAGYESRESGSR